MVLQSAELGKIYAQNKGFGRKKQMSQTQLWQGLIDRRQTFLQIQQTDAYLKTIAENERDWWQHLMPIDNGE